MYSRNFRGMNEPPRRESGEADTDQRIEGGHLLPPIASVALVVAVLVGVAGIGLGYRLGQESVTPAPAPMASIVTETAAPTSSPQDLQAASVSDRLQNAYLASAPDSWAICGLGGSVACHMLVPNVDRGLDFHQTLAFTAADLAELDQPVVGPGHLILAASLGSGTPAGSLVTLGQTGGQVLSNALTAIEPGNSGADFFDLGEQRDGTYAILISFAPGGDAAAPSAGLDSYLAFFVVAG